MDLGSVFVPLGSTNGTTNAVMFGVVLMAYRDANLVVHKDRPMPKMVHHDMDAPPWWHFKRKKMIYIDGFAEKGHRGLMQFMLVPQNGRRKIPRLGKRFSRCVRLHQRPSSRPNIPMQSTRRWPSAAAWRSIASAPIATAPMARAAAIPRSSCPIDEVKTDRVRLDA